MGRCLLRVIIGSEKEKRIETRFVAIHSQGEPELPQFGLAGCRAGLCFPL